MDKEETPVRRRNIVVSRLKQERDRHGWSQSDLAARLGTSQVNISRWEKGLTAPGPYFRQRLAEVFAKSLEELGLFTDEVGDETSVVLLSPASPVYAVSLNTLPFRRNPFFTGREDILTTLFTTLMRRQTAALTDRKSVV